MMSKSLYGTLCFLQDWRWRSRKPMQKNIQDHPILKPPRFAQFWRSICPISNNIHKHPKVESFLQVSRTGIDLSYQQEHLLLIMSLTGMKIKINLACKQHHPASQMKLFFSLSFGNQHSIPIELSCKQDHLALIMASRWRSIWSMCNDIQKHVHPRLNLNCKFCESALSPYWVSSVSSSSGTNRAHHNHKDEV